MIWNGMKLDKKYNKNILFQKNLKTIIDIKNFILFGQFQYV